MKTRKINSFYKIIVLSLILCALISYQPIIESYFTLKNYNIALAIKKTQIITPIESYSLLRNLLKTEDEFLKLKIFLKVLINRERNYFLFLGYQTRVQRFYLPNGKTSNNIWVIKEGKLNDEIIVV